MFARADFANGAIEPYDSSDIDRTALLGLAIDGTEWGRQGDVLGLGAAVNGTRQFISASLMLAVSACSSGWSIAAPWSEAIAEAYYLWKPLKLLAVTLDYQLIMNPRYNRDRGPANVLAVRVHGQF